MLDAPRAMPTTSSVQRNHAFNRAASSCALDGMLSQLAFYSEPPAPPVPQDHHSSLSKVTTKNGKVKRSSNDHHSHHHNLSQPESPPFWRRLFCTSIEDQDLYFDALEIIDDRKDDDDDEYLIAKSKLDSIWILRGGGGGGESNGNGNGNHWCNNFNKNSDNNSYRTESPSSSGSDDSFRSLPPVPTPSLHEYCEAQLIEQPHGSNSSSNGNGNIASSGYNNMNGHSNNYKHNHYSDKENYQQQQNRNVNDDGYSKLRGPLPPKELPTRFLRAGKNDPIEGQRRYEATLQWRKNLKMDSILTEHHPNFNLIKQHYPHYFHLKGREGQPVFFELPPKTNLAAMRKGGIDLDTLLRHYAMVTEFQWQYVERDDFARSLYIIDLDGIRMTDFVGECVDYVRKCSDFTGQHYPERAGTVLVINVPGWFKLIWNVVKPMVDEVTLKKIRILRGKQEIFDELLERIPIENIPPEYGGQSMPLGQSPEEDLMRRLMKHNAQLAAGDYSCGGRNGKPEPCPFCSWKPARSY